MNRQQTDNQIIESQDYSAPKQIGLFAMPDFAARRAEAPKSDKRKELYDHEYQELGQRLEKFYGKRIWAVFSTPKGSEENVKKAHAACVRYGKVGNFSYFRGVLNNL